MWPKPRTLIVGLMLAAATLSGRAPVSVSNKARAQTAAPQMNAPPQPKKLTTADLAQLRWLEGSWRGTGDVEQPFFERYYFENDSTLAVEGFEDETLSKVTDVTRFELKDGQFGNRGEGSRWVVTQLTAQSVTFEPVVKARNSFRWERESQDVWRAVLDWPATANAPARRRVYKMERWPQRTVAPPKNH
jgi:hypothetical protein